MIMLVMMVTMNNDDNNHDDDNDDNDKDNNDKNDNEVYAYKRI